MSMMAEGSWVHIWDELKKCLILRSVAGFPSDRVDSLSYMSGEGLTGWVYKYNEIANVPNLMLENRWSSEPEFETLLPSGQAKNTLVVPLAIDGWRFGVLGVVNKRCGAAFNSNDEQRLLILARQVAGEIKRTNLHKDHCNLQVVVVNFLMSAIKIHDSYTHAHLKKVAHLAVEFGKHISLCSTSLNYLRIAALLHDVGKIAVSNQILHKAEKLATADWESIRQHPYFGAHLIHSVSELRKIEPWIHYHHERWDGTGYPDGLKMGEIPLEARILAIIDSYNAMTSDRPYRRALSIDAARAEIRKCAGTQFDPDLTEKFIDILAERKPILH